MSHNEYQLPLSARIRSARFAPDLEATLVELAERVEEATTAEQIIRRARSTYVPAPRGANDRHGLHAVPRTVGPAVILGGLASAAQWIGRTRLHKVVAAAATFTLASGAALTPSVVAHSAADPAAAHGHGHGHHAAPAGLPPVTQLPAPARHRRRRHHRAQPSPRPTPRITFTPIPPVPSPSPSVSIPPPTPQVVPSPSPSVSVTPPVPSSAPSSPAPPGPADGM